MTEEVKETKPKTKAKSTKTTKAKEETKVETQTVTQPQIDPNMAMMFQQFMTFMQQGQMPQATVEESKQTRVRKTSGKTKTITKAQLRRKYKDVDVFLVSVVGGSCSFVGRNGYQYNWDYLGDVQAVPVEDVLNMQDSWLKSPWLAIDEEENDEELIDDLITCLRLESSYEHLYILSDMEQDIHSIDIEKVERIIEKTKGTTLAKDMATITQNKINSGELTDIHLITDLEKVLKCNFRK